MGNRSGALLMNNNSDKQNASPPQGVYVKALEDESVKIIGDLVISRDVAVALKSREFQKALHSASSLLQKRMDHQREEQKA